MGAAAAQGAWLIAAGGVTYTLGATIYALRWPNPWPKSFGYHELFHCATILASVFHFTAVRAPLPPPHAHHYPQLLALYCTGAHLLCSTTRSLSPGFLISRWSSGSLRGVSNSGLHGASATPLSIWGLGQQRYHPSSERA